MDRYRDSKNISESQFMNICFAEISWDILFANRARVAVICNLKYKYKKRRTQWRLRMGAPGGRNRTSRSLRLDRGTYQYMYQDIVNIKTMLLKLKRVLQEVSRPTKHFSFTCETHVQQK
ncbi:hypothetical protein C0J52_24683 [Blattella germanica]|nr:hypothetical protein C0J52_24683 [Blattella germanica]